MTQSLSRIVVLTSLALSAAACTFNSESSKPTPVVVNPAPAAPSGTVIVTPAQ